MNISICFAGAIFIKEVMCSTSYREILQLDSFGLNRTEIAANSGCSRNTVASMLKRATECGLSWPLPADVTDQLLAGILYPSAVGKPEYMMSDYEYVYREMQCKGVTLNLLWLEYVDTYSSVIKTIVAEK